MKVLERGDWTIEVEPRTWVEIVSFLTKNGWKPGVLPVTFLAPRFEFDDELAAHFSQAGSIILEEAMKNPMAVFSAIQFDMGKFAEIVEFAKEGAFVIRSQS